MYHIDYLASYWNARQLANAIEQYWHRKGYKWVRVWLVKDEKTTTAKLYYVRSNLKFRVPETEEDFKNSID